MTSKHIPCEKEGPLGGPFTPPQEEFGGVWKTRYCLSSLNSRNKSVVSNICYFHPYLGKISNLTNIFQKG